MVQLTLRDPSVIALKVVGGLLDCGGAFKRVRFVVRFCRFKCRFQSFVVVAFDRFNFLLGEFTTSYETLSEGAPDKWHLRDRLVEDGLSKGGLVGLIVPVFAPAIHVDDNVATKGLPIVKSGFDCRHDRERIVAVDMENRCFHDLGHISAVTT